MPSETVVRGGKVTSHHIGADKSAEDVAKASDTAKLTDTTRLKAKSESGFPKRSDFGSQDDYLKAIKSFNNKRAGQLEALK